MIPPAKEPETLEGVLLRFVFTSADGAYAVARLQRDDGSDETVSVVGALGGLNEGERVRLVGRREQSAKYGDQFRVEAGWPVLPHSEAGIRAYLASGKVEGIGPKLAGRIVDKFGADALDVILTAPERLAEVEGIGRQRSRAIQEAFREQEVQREAFVFLQGHVVSAALAARIFKRYGGQTIALVRENPYRMAEEVRGVGFATADRIARSLGFASDSPARVAAALVHLLGQALDDGHTYLPRDMLLERVANLTGTEGAGLPRLPAEATAGGRLPSGGADVLDALLAEGRLEQEDDGVWLRTPRALEIEAAERVFGLRAAQVPRLKVDTAAFEQQRGVTLAPAQREALEAAARHPLLVLTGGPGTGKTTIVRALVHAVERSGGRILLAAPTGRAARRLAESTGREARTLHRLLEYSPREDAFRRDEDQPLEAEALVVDESSMLDLALFTAVLRAVRPGTRLVLVGDADQLPSVGAGNVLADLLSSGAVPAVRLREIFRQASASDIVVNAHRVQAGEVPVPAADPDRGDFFIVTAEDPERARALIGRLVAERIPAKFNLNSFDDVQVLAPMHRGTCGAHALNETLQALLNPDGEPLGGPRGLRVGDKVMQVRNDYEKEVFNGDVGRIEARTSDGVRVRFDERRVDYAADALDALVLAYACSVHKSQGSEYPAVVMPVLTEHWVMLQRNLLYTAVTRGRRLVVLVGQARALRRAVENDQGLHRFTALARRLREAAA